MLCTAIFTSSSVESYEGLVDIGKEHASYKIGVSQMSSMLNLKIIILQKRMGIAQVGLSQAVRLS